MGVATGFGLLSTIGFVDVGLVFWFFPGLVLGAVVGFLTGDGSLFGCLFMNLFRVVWFKALGHGPPHGDLARVHVLWLSDVGS